MAVHLLILGEREGVVWVLENERMAFPGYRRNALTGVAAGDQFLLYTTRGCFHNPTRDRGRVVGRARVTSAVEALEKPLAINDRVFELGCGIAIEQLLPRGEGVILADLVHRLSVFPNPKAWSAKLRRPLLTLPDRDAQVLTAELGSKGAALAAVRRAVGSY